MKALLVAALQWFSDEPIWETRDAHGNTPLIVAAQQGHKRMAKLLCAAACNVNATNLAGNAALHYAQLYGHAELAEYLRRKGADESLCNRHGQTPAEMRAARPAAPRASSRASSSAARSG